jgi:hypothetical protein
MTKGLIAAMAVAMALGVAACSDDTLDPVVLFDMEPVAAQPWNASGELVDAGQMCPAGDRASTGLAFPDGSPMSWEQFAELADEAEAAGGSPMDFDRTSWEEYRCSDGSGTFTIREEVDNTSGQPELRGEVVGGTGAYTDMTGTCTIVVTENEARTAILSIIATCEFDMGSSE